MDVLPCKLQRKIFRPLFFNFWVNSTIFRPPNFPSQKIFLVPVLSYLAENSGIWQQCPPPYLPQRRRILSPGLTKTGRLKWFWRPTHPTFLSYFTLNSDEFFYSHFDPYEGKNFLNIFSEFFSFFGPKNAFPHRKTWKYRKTPLLLWP
jgi:hypothetical protein